MSVPLPQGNQRYTYADYCAWDDGQRWELVEGVPYMMSPAPNQRHQEISGELFGQLRDYLKGKSCKVLHAPFDVRLNAANGDDAVVQPDLLVVCDSAKLDGKSCNGAPDLVIEVISPSTARHDRWIKYNLYKNAGVREYWIADPDSRTVSVNILSRGEYVGKAYGDTDIVSVAVLPGCEIDLSGVFAE